MLSIRRYLPTLAVLSMLLAACTPAAAPPTAAPAKPAAPAAAPTTAPAPAAAPTTAPAPAAAPTTAAAPAAPKAEQAKLVKIGLSGPITGAQAVYGQDYRMGFNLALEQLNQNNMVPGYRFEGVIEDAKSDPKEAANVAQKFVAAKEVIAVVAGYSSTECLAQVPIFQKAGLPYVTPSGSHPDITKTGDYIFRPAPTTPQDIGPVAAWAIKDLGAKRLAFIARNDDFGRIQTDSWKAVAQANGVQVVASEFINPTDSDFKSILTKIKATNPDVTGIAAFQVETPLLLQQSKDLGFKTQFMSGAALYTPEFLKLAGSSAEGHLLVTTFYPGDKAEPVQAFVKAFTAKYNATPSKFSAHAYESTMIVADALKRAQSTEPAKIRDALKTTSRIGLIGKIEFDQERNVPELGAFRLLVKDGQFVPWTKQ